MDVCFCIISGCLLLLTPCALFAQETGTAVIYGTGSVFLNGAALSNSSAVTVGDVVQTRDNGVANINAPGATIVVESNTIVRFQSGGFALDRGNISVATGKGMSEFARDFKITSTSGDWTEFYVTRASGSIQIIARKNSVTVSCGSNSSPCGKGNKSLATMQRIAAWSPNGRGCTHRGENPNP